MYADWVGVAFCVCTALAKILGSFGWGVLGWCRMGLGATLLYMLIFRFGYRLYVKVARRPPQVR